MRVLQINSVCGIGSTGRIATDLYRVIEKNGGECKIAFGRGNAPKGYNTYKIGTKFNNYLHVLLTRLLDRHCFSSRMATKKLIANIKEYNPDVVHLHNLHGYYINIKILFDYLKVSNKPVVWTLHDCWAFTGHCSHFDYIGCNKWENSCFDCPQKKEYPKSLLIDNSKNNYKLKKDIFTSIERLAIVTPSKWLGELVKKSFLNKYPVKVINNGIDLDIFKQTKSNFREAYNLKDKFIVLGVASVWSKKKGLDTFLSLSGLLNDSYKIVLVGLNEKQSKALPKNILAIAKTNNVKELAEIYSAADVFVNPTLEDNFPTTNIEALACGTPVITFSSGGSPECIDEGNGIVVEKENLKDLFLNIEKIKKGDIIFTKEQCIRRAKKLFEKNDKFNEYIKFYGEIL